MDCGRGEDSLGHNRLARLVVSLQVSRLEDCSTSRRLAVLLVVLVALVALVDRHRFILLHSAILFFSVTLHLTSCLSFLSVPSWEEVCLTKRHSKVGWARAGSVQGLEEDWEAQEVSVED